jgi:fucose permease
LRVEGGREVRIENVPSYSLIRFSGASERFGYRKTVIFCLTLIIAYITIFFMAPNIETLLVGEILCGMLALTCPGRTEAI